MESGYFFAFLSEIDFSSPTKIKFPCTQLFEEFSKVVARQENHVDDFYFSPNSVNCGLIETYSIQ